jgi:heptosyltransferase-2
MSRYVFKKKSLSIIIGAVDLLGRAVFAPVLFFRKILEKGRKPEKILVVRLDQAGDCVQAIPFFEHLRKKYPSASITAAVLEGNAYLFRENTDVDKIITIPVSWFVKGKNVAVKDLLRFCDDIRSSGFDLGFDLRGDIRDIAVMFFCGVKKIIGYGCGGGGFMIDSQLPYDRDMHEIDKNLRLLGEGPLGDAVSMRFPGSGESKAREFIESKGAANKFRIVVHPFAGTPSKLWGYEKYSELIGRILKADNKAAVLITGGPMDAGLWDKFAADGVINAIGLDMNVSIGLIKQCDVFIGSDSFVQYIAAYSGLKSCVIAGYTSKYERWAPKAPAGNTAVFSVPVECGPCELAQCKGKEHKCMDVISVEEVFNRIKGWI